MDSRNRKSPSQIHLLRNSCSSNTGVPGSSSHTRERRSAGSAKRKRNLPNIVCVHSVLIIMKICALPIGIMSLLFALTGCASGRSEAAPPSVEPVTRELLQTVELQAPVPQHAVTGITTIQPGASAERHLHHGVESGYVLAGEVEIISDGQPGKIYNVGETFITYRDLPHVSRNPGTIVARALVTWIVDSDKPLTTPVQ